MLLCSCAKGANFFWSTFAGLHKVLFHICCGHVHMQILFLSLDFRAVDRIVGVSNVVATVEGLAIVLSQRPAILETLNEIRVGGEDTTESNEVTSFVSDLGSFFRVSSVTISRNEFAFPDCSEWIQAILLFSGFTFVIARFDKVDVGKVRMAFLDLADNVAPGVVRCFIFHV